MEYEELKDEITAIAEIAAGVPEAFRERCFDLLLTHLLQSQKPTPPPKAEPEDPTGGTVAGDGTGSEHE